jgi:hypothetical protein
MAAKPKTKLQIPSIDEVLFVCTGNTCRSPMAEYLMRAMAAERGYNMTVSSRGLHAGAGGRYSGGGGFYGRDEKRGYGEGRRVISPEASEETIRKVRELYPGSDVFLHVPTGLSLREIYERVTGKGLILTMEEKHRDDVITSAMDYIPLENLLQRVYTIREYADEWGADERGWMPMRLDVADPIGGGHGGRRWDEFDDQTNPVSSGMGFHVAAAGQGAKSALELARETRDKKNDTGKGKGRKRKAEKPVDRYLECRDTLVRCLGRILDECDKPGEVLPSHDAILERRRRIPLQEEVLVYERLLRSIPGEAEQHGDVEAETWQYEEIERFREDYGTDYALPEAVATGEISQFSQEAVVDGEYDRPYLAPTLVRILKALDNEAVELVERKPRGAVVVSHHTSSVQSPGGHTQ